MVPVSGISSCPSYAWSPPRVYVAHLVLVVAKPGAGATRGRISHHRLGRLSHHRRLQVAPHRS
eukprot:4519654-Pyramimonas_sp.AAC.1